MSSKSIRTVGTASLPYRLDPLTDAEVQRWDELIAGCDNRTLFHHRAWLEYLAESRGVQIRHWAIRSGDRTMGYFCGGILRLGPFRVLGSPLKSWGTNVMGPLIEGDVDQHELLRALDRLAIAERFAMIELEHPALSKDALDAVGFEPVRDWTYSVPLVPEDSQVTWRALESTCRNRIRKAEKAGLRVEDADGNGVADEFYDFYLDLMRRKGMALPFSRRTARLLVSHLKKVECLFTLRVLDRGGRLLAVGLFPHDDDTMYFWGGASLADGHDLCPNDLLHWTAMQMAAHRGLRTYNMSGHGRFKRKFGGALTEVTRWHKCYWRTARWARKGYEIWFRHRNLVSRFLAPFRTAIDRNRLPASTRTQTKGSPSRPSFRLSDIRRAPPHDFPIRDEILYQYLPLSPEMDILEVGPGSGFTAFCLAPQIRSLTLLDVTPGNVDRLRSHLGNIPNLAFVCADVCKPDLAAGLGRSFDSIYALEIFGYVQDPEACLRNLAGLLRPGGHLLLEFPNYPPPQSPGLTYFNTKAELDRLLHEAGFSSWTVGALHLRPWARFVYEYGHEKPIRFYRERRSQADPGHPLIYDQTCAFQRQRQLPPFKYLLHASWAVLAWLMRLGGPAFTQTALENKILSRNLLVLAKR
jgi:SAM-dependent methyltransferase